MLRYGLTKLCYFDVVFLSGNVHLKVAMLSYS